MNKNPMRRSAAAMLIALAMAPAAQASLFSGETLDAVANGAAWVVLLIAPLAAIGIFLIIHILPEKIAEKKQHPQLDAIKTLCLLSLVFGGMLWPLAWLWAYTKPVVRIGIGIRCAVPACMILPGGQASTGTTIRAASHSEGWPAS